MNEVSRVWVPPWVLDIRGTVECLHRGSGDPAMRYAPDGSIWRACHTPDGPGTLRLLAVPEGVRGTGWGPGGPWLVEHFPELIGALDDPEELRTDDPVVNGLVQRARGFRICRTGRVWEALVPAILEQKVVGTEAFRAWRYLLRRFGEPAPGPVAASMRVPPPPQVWAQIPSWEWHRSGIEPVRMRTIRGATSMDVERHPDKLTVLRGVGPWTAAETRMRAVGDPDAVPVGDFHIPRVVGQTLAGSPVDDAGMLELLEPFAGQRGRVVRLCVRYGEWPQRKGPRMSVRDYRSL
ncbi:DNA-3-methyladenine glycosylase [Gordonia sp. (in: high G+C Gram-positive bacteria)]|uniref:DNA-3-methyladenine glycosylase family protein n=1 Tax=Gordonia sp. (in: high G+C Gram-positive bacteria) TaxID=84139 RepID=UPI0026136BCF|nr:3-methyladenine DNA glycosylase [Gordonia sp. (in: high G+C Gram-positive bacteria)]HMS77350.1 3-methyladenine DNA glycosylase [Gordonia sp. (in: high G+C Gram-positive bacteria)]